MINIRVAKITLLTDLVVQVPFIQRHDNPHKWYCPSGDYIKVARKMMAEMLTYGELVCSSDSPEVVPHKIILPKVADIGAISATDNVKFASVSLDSDLIIELAFLQYGDRWICLDGDDYIQTIRHKMAKSILNDGHFFRSSFDAFSQDDMYCGWGDPFNDGNYIAVKLPDVDVGEFKERRV